MLYISNGPGDLIFSTWRTDEPSPSAAEVSQAYVEMADGLERAGAVPLLERLFCELNSVNSYLEARSESPARLWPVPPTVVEGAPCEGPGLAGIHLVGVRPGERQEPQIVAYHNTPCGIEVAGSEAVYLALSDVGKLLPQSEGRPPAQETRESIHLAEELLAEREWSFHDVRRTWFYLHEILDWYDDFNCARNQEFDRMGFPRGASDTALPVSTGIFAHNPRGAWCVFDLLAVRSPNGRRVDVHRLSNPRQSEAPEYGSAFSRGLALTSERCRYLLVSGTASIDDQGRSVHVNDFERQTERTIDTVAALIEVGGGGVDDICQATAFIKRRDDISELKSILARRGMGRLPVVYTVGDVCRDELLFELDATAVVPIRGGEEPVGYS
jgi:enamine deaminase RidA (YjgF/YER057c/UK114 family)